MHHPINFNEYLKFPSRLWITSKLNSCYFGIFPLLDPALSLHSEKKEVRRVFCAFCSKRALQRLHCLSSRWSLSPLPSLPNTHLKPPECYLFAMLLTEIVQIAWERTVNHNYMTSCFWQQVPLVPFLEPFGLCFMFFLWSEIFYKSLWTFQSLPLYLTHTVLQLPIGLGRSKAENSLLAWLQLLYHFTSQLLINFPY